MLIDFELRRLKKNGKSYLRVSYIDENGEIKPDLLPVSKIQNWVSCLEHDTQKSDKYTTWDKKPVKLVDSKNFNKYSMYYFLDECNEEYKEKLYKSNTPNIFFIDIETEISDNGFTDPRIADTAVISIAIVFKNRCEVWGLKSLTEVEQSNLEKDMNEYFSKLGDSFKVKYVQFKDSNSNGVHRTAEWNMLNYFFNIQVPKMPVITGWYFDDYDWMFLVKRAYRIGVELDVPKISLSNKMYPYNDELDILPKHRVIVDYMKIYKKYQQSVGIKESNALDFVSNKLLEVRKLEYTGSLKDLYENDYYKFILYNCIDTALVCLIDKYKKYFAIMNKISELSKTRIMAGLKAVETTEGLIRQQLKEEEGIVFIKQNNWNDNRTFSKKEKKIDGGWVKDPVTGMHKWITNFDFASLYPNTMIMFNISPESYLGELKEEVDENGNIELYVIYEKRKIKFDADKHILCIFESEDKETDTINIMKTVFRKKDSVTKIIISKMFKDRKAAKKEMSKVKDEIEELKKELKEIEDKLTIVNKK